MKIVKLALASASFLASATAVSAQGLTSPVSSNLSSIGGLFSTVFNLLIGIVGGLAIIFLIIGGIRYILAGGDEKATKSAKEQITAALIGLVIALLAVALVLIVGNILGSGGLNNVGTTPTTK